MIIKTNSSFDGNILAKERFVQGTNISKGKMKTSIRIGVIALLVAALCPLARAGTINFENMPQPYLYLWEQPQQYIGNYWAGVDFEPQAAILDTRWASFQNYNYYAYPPHSGYAVVFSLIVPDITAVFDNPANFVSMWYTSAIPLVLNAYDVNNNLIDTVVGEPNLGYNSLLGLTESSSDIKSVEMIATGNYFTIDDFSASSISGLPRSAPSVPDGGATLMLLGMGTLGLGLLRRKLQLT